VYGFRHCQPGADISTEVAAQLIAFQQHIITVQKENNYLCSQIGSADDIRIFMFQTALHCQ
jgi:hypothetical protein